MRNCNRRWNGIDWRRRGRSSNLFKLRFRLNCDGATGRARIILRLWRLFSISRFHVPADTLSGKDRSIRWTTAGDQEDGFPTSNPLLFSYPILLVHLPAVSPSRAITMHIEPTRITSDDVISASVPLSSSSRRIEISRGADRLSRARINRALKGHGKFMTAR